MNKLMLISYLLFFCLNDLAAQEMNEYQWKYRVLVIKTDSPENELYKRQLALLRSDVKGLEERKLLVIRLHEKGYIKGLEEVNWQKIVDSELASMVKEFVPMFEVILIGLDGRKKIRQSSVLSSVDLFSVIDGMPMRRTEIRKKKRG